MIYYFLNIFSGIERAGRSVSYVVYFVFLGDVWIRTQRAAGASMRATN
jgi:hypothetical protein